MSSYDSTGVSTYYLKAPSLKSAKGSKTSVKVTWGKVSGASGYYVYRKVSGGKYKKIATVKGGSKVSYADKKGKKGKTYYYTVRAYKSRYTSAYVSKGVKGKRR